MKSFLEITNKEYLQIYFWQTLSLVSRFASMLVVIPLISSDVEIFGLYSICVSIVLYLSYADLGFLPAGQKFASEAVAKGDWEEEYQITGFILFLLFLMFLPFILFGLVLASHPNFLISNLQEHNILIAKHLFLIISLLVPLQVYLERLVNIITVIRLKDYLVTKIMVVANIIKIIAIYLFINDENTVNIVSYFSFITLLSIVSSIYAAWVIKKHIGYSFQSLISHTKFDLKIFKRLAKLSLLTFISTLAFILYFESDLILIAALLGPEQVGIYAIGFTLLNFFRGLQNIVYSPFSQRLNHYIGQNSIEKFDELVRDLILIGFVIHVITFFILYLCIDELILFWVGKSYNESHLYAGIMVLSLIASFIIKPATYYYISILRYKFILLTALVGILAYYATIFWFSSEIELITFAYAKLNVSIAIFLVSCFGLRHNLLKITKIKSMLFTNLLIVLFLSLSIPALLDFLFVVKDKSISNLIALSSVCILLVIVLVLINIGVNHRGRTVIMSVLGLKQ